MFSTGYGSCMICGWCMDLGHEGRKPSGCLADAVSTAMRDGNLKGVSQMQSPQWRDPRTMLAVELSALCFFPNLFQFFQPSVTHRDGTRCRMHVVWHWVNVLNICKHMLQMDLLEIFPFFKNISWCNLSRVKDHSWNGSIMKCACVCVCVRVCMRVCMRVWEIWRCGHVVNISTSHTFCQGASERQLQLKQIKPCASTSDGSETLQVLHQRAGQLK